MSAPLVARRAEEARAQKAMVAALPWPSPLRNKLSKCGEFGHWAWNAWRCHSPACVRCRSLYASVQKKQLTTTLHNARNADLSMVTIMFAVANDAEGIGPVWIKGKSDLRNRINAMRRENARWDRVAITGWMEADPIVFDDLATLGSQQRTMLASLNMPAWRADGGPAWVVHLHAVAHHPAIDWQSVSGTLTSQWPGERRVHVQQFSEDRSVESNLSGVAGYATKYRAGRWIGAGYDYWPAPWMAEYYGWMDRFSHGWKSMRFRMTGKGSVDCHQLVNDDHIEPMYSTCSFNSYPILYTDARRSA